MHPKLGDPGLRSSQARGGIPRHRDEVTAAAAPTPPGRGRPPAHWHPGGGRACGQREGDRRPGTMSAMLRWGPGYEGAARPVQTPGRRLGGARRPLRPPSLRRTPPSGRGLAGLWPGLWVSVQRRGSGPSALSGRPGQVAHSPATRPSRGGAATGVATPSAGNARPTQGLGGRRRPSTAPPTAAGPASQAPPRPAGPAHRWAGLNKCAAPTREPVSSRFSRSGAPPELRSWGSCSLGTPQPSQGPHPRDGGAGLGTGGGEAANPTEAGRCPGPLFLSI